jgi:hypothetical protein
MLVLHRRYFFMNGGFNISPESLQGLGTDLTSQSSLWGGRNLALVKGQSREWKLIDLGKEKTSSAIVIQGKELADLMQAVANGVKTPPMAVKALFSEKEFRQLASNAKFRNLCRLVPGMESPRHSAIMTKTHGAFQRTSETAKLLGKGLDSIQRQGLEGRYVGQDQEEHPYWIRELVFRDSSKTSREADILTDGWHQDKTTDLSLKEWEGAKLKEWELKKPGIAFLPWIAAQAWQAKSKEAFEKAHPSHPFIEAEFIDWQRAQIDPELAVPTWRLKEISGTNTEADFQVWRRYDRKLCLR